MRWLGGLTGAPDEHVETAVNLLEEIGRRYQDEQAAAAAVAEWAASPRCCGTPWENNQGRLYLNHSTGDSCPFCGDPPENGRLRVYVGSDQEKRVQALTAVGNWRAWVVARKKTTSKPSSI